MDTPPGRLAVIAVLLALVLFPAARAAAAVSFAPAGDIQAGQGLKTVAVADVNRDGFLDVLMVVDAGPPRVRLALGGPGLEFTEAPGLPTGPMPAAVAVGDLNRDGWPDVVVVSRGSNMLHVFLNEGDGSFGPRRDVATAAGPVAVALSDLDRDGRPDVVVIALTAARASVFLGDGQGGFGTRRDVEVGTRPVALAIADLDRDGVPDLAVVRNTPAGAVSVLLGRGDGTFGPRTSVKVGARPTAIAAGDLTGDGIADLVTANSGDSTIALASGNGDGTFQDGANKFIGSGPVAIVIADFDGDGKNDVAVSIETGQAVSVRAGNGVSASEETFRARVVVGLGSGPGALAAGDVDRDGRPDIVVALPGDDVVRPLLNTTALVRADTLVSLAASNLGATGFSPGGVAAGDLDGDGRPEVVVTDLADGGRVTIQRWSGQNSNFDEVASVTVGGAPVLPVIADFNRDGRPDILVLDRAAAVFKVLRQRPNGSFQVLPAVQAGSLTAILAFGVADVDRDGALDLVVAGIEGSTTFIVTLRGDGNGAFTAQGGRIRLRCPPESADVDPCAFAGALAMADVDRDGILDVVAAIAHPLDDSGFNYTNKVAVFLGEGGGRFGGDTPVDSIEYRLQDSFDGPGVRALAVADVDNDGALDVVAASDAGTLFLLLGAGTGYFDDPVTVQTVADAGKLAPGGALGPGTIVAADVNRDGNVDLIVPGFSFAGGKSSVGLHLGTGAGDFVPLTVFPKREFLSTGARAIGIAPVDLDRDGSLDVIVVGEDIGNGPTIEILRSRLSIDNGATVFRFSRSGSPASYTVDESVGVAQVAVIRNVVTNVPASVQVTTTVCSVPANCTATADTDYAPVTTTLTFEPGEVSKLVRIPIQNDGVAEGDERLMLTFNPPNGFDAVLTIRDVTINGLIPSVSSVPGIFNLQVTGTGFTPGSRVLWNCNSLSCAGRAERATRWSSTVRLDSDVNFADVGDFTDDASPRVVPVRVVNRTVGARLTNCFPFSVVKLRKLDQEDGAEIDPDPRLPFFLEVTPPPAPGGSAVLCQDSAVEFQETSTVSFNGKILPTVRQPLDCGSGSGSPCTALIAAISGDDARPGRHLVTVPRQFANGQVSDDNAQPSAAILVIGATDKAPRLEYVGSGSFVNDGVQPNVGTAGSTYVFRVKYKDGDGHPPFTGSPRVDIRKANGTKVAGSPFSMTYMGEAANGWSIYEYRGPLPAGNYKYKFTAMDSTGRDAKGPPTSFKPGPTSQAPD